MDMAIASDTLVSIIVPIYRVQDFLPQCVDSILAQTHSALEILLVDDGSPDDCGKICEEYAKKDARIRVIHKKNGGLSDARNAGMRVATGDWYFFLDADDYLHPRAIETLLTAAEKSGCDLAWCDYLETDEDGSIRYTERYPGASAADTRIASLPYEILPWQEAEGWLYEEGTRGQCMVVAWNKLCRATLFSNEPTIAFPVGKIFEDSFTTYKLIARAKKVCVLDAPLYLYRQRESSIMKKHTDVTYRHILEASAERMLFYRDLGETGLYKKELNMTLYYIIRVYQVNRESRKDLKEQYRYFYRNYFLKEHWSRAKRIRLGSFLIGNPVYRLISRFEKAYNAKGGRA